MANEQSLASYLVREVRPPNKKNLDSDVEWIARSLGLVEVRDRRKSAMKVFRTLVKIASKGKSLGSKQVSNQVGLSRGTVVSHLNHMMASGVVIRRESRYELRMRSVEKTVDEVEKDVCRVLQNIKEIARDVDYRLGLQYRK